MSKPIQRRFVYVRMVMGVEPSSSRPGWWHAARKASKPEAVASVMTQFSYGGKMEVETTDETAKAVMAWAETIPGWKGQLKVEIWENGTKVQG